MGATKPRLSFDEHQRLAGDLFEMRNRLLTIGVELSNKYPKDSRQAKLARKVHETLDALRSEMDDVLARDFPDQFQPSVYYPANKLKEMGKGR